MVLALLVLAVAGVSHAAAVLLLPFRTGSDAFSRVAMLAPLGRTVTLPAAGVPNDPLPFRDPSLVSAVCRYDLDRQPFRLAMTPFSDGFVTVGFHGRHGLAYYGMTVRAADAIVLDVALTEAAVTREAGASLGQHVVTIQAPEPEGFVLVETPAVAGPGHADALERLAAFRCRSEGP